MILFKNEIGNWKINNYTNEPTTQMYDTFEAVPLNGYAKLNQEQEARFLEPSNDINYIMTGEVTAPTLEYLKEVKLNELNSKYTKKLEIGLKYNLKEIDYTFNLDDNTENNIAKQKIDWDIQKTQNDYDEGTITFAITDANNHQVIFDIATFLKFSALFGKTLKSLKIAYAAKRNAIYLAQNESELNSIVIEFD